MHALIGSRGRVALAVIVLLLVASAVIAVVTRRAQAESEVRRAAVRSEIRRYDSVQRAIDGHAKRVTAEFGQIYAERDAAMAAARKRHDQVVRAAGSISSNLAFAKSEQAAVAAAESHLGLAEEGLDEFAQSAASVLGDDAVRQYRTDTQAWTTSLRLHLETWSRAVSDIVDADMMELRGNGSASATSEVEHLYSASDEASARAGAQQRTVVADAQQIRAKLRARIADAKGRLAKI